jgi:hypothetical protein
VNAGSIPAPGTKFLRDYQQRLMLLSLIERPMTDELGIAAKQISLKFELLTEEWRGFAERSFEVLERLDPELATLAHSALSDRLIAARWFSRPVRSLGMWSPWACLAEGRRDAVAMVLSAIIYGDLI